MRWRRGTTAGKFAKISHVDGTEWRTDYYGWNFLEEFGGAGSPTHESLSDAIAHVKKALERDIQQHEPLDAGKEQARREIIDFFNQQDGS